jgi:DNA integrity scanning protein DisA with diadenylate cyclase activity
MEKKKLAGDEMGADFTPIIPALSNSIVRIGQLLSELGKEIENLGRSVNELGRIGCELRIQVQELVRDSEGATRRSQMRIKKLRATK